MTTVGRFHVFEPGGPACDDPACGAIHGIRQTVDPKTPEGGLRFAADFFKARYPRSGDELVRNLRLWADEVEAELRGPTPAEPERDEAEREEGGAVTECAHPRWSRWRRTDDLHVRSRDGQSTVACQTRRCHKCGWTESRPVYTEREADAPSNAR